MQGVIYLFFNNVMATHPGDYLLFPSSGVQFQNLGRQLTSVTPCFPLLPGCSSTTSNSNSSLRLLAFPFFRGAVPELRAATHLCDTLLSPSSGVQFQNLGRRLTSVTPCFPLLPGCSSTTSNSNSPRSTLLFPSSVVPKPTFAKQTHLLPPNATHHRKAPKTSSHAKGTSLPAGPP